MVFDPKPVRRVLDINVAKKLTNMLVDVVSNEGTARQAVIDGFRIAGKTGTTQKIIDGKYSNRHHVASFAGYFPAENLSIMITIVVDEPKMSKGRLAMVEVSWVQHLEKSATNNKLYGNRADSEK